MQTLISSDFFSLQKPDVASNQVFETDERSFPGPQLLSQLGSRWCSQIPLTSTLSHLPDVPPVLLQLSFLVFRLVTCGDQSAVFEFCAASFECCDRFIWLKVKESIFSKEIEADTRHREIVHAQMNPGGANVKSVAAPAVKVQEWTPQMLTKLDKDRASTFRSATMRASCSW